MIKQADFTFVLPVQRLLIFIQHVPHFVLVRDALLYNFAAFLGVLVSMSFLASNFARSFL